MKKNADDFYLFIIPVKHRPEQFNTKTARTMILIAIVCYPIMYFFIKNFEDDNIYLPETLIFKGIALFFLIFVCISILSFAFTKFKFYDSLVWLLTSIAFLEIAYFLILMEYLSFLTNKLPLEWATSIFNVLLIIPIFLIVISLGRYIKIINTGEAGRTNQKAATLEKKFNHDSNQSMDLSKNNKFILSASFIGVGLGGMIETSFTLFFIFLGCAYLISWIVSKFLIVAYIKFKFPEQYLDENIKKMLKKERSQKK